MTLGEPLVIAERRPMLRNFSMLGPLEYFDTLMSGISNAQRRVMLKTMIFEKDHFSSLLSRGLQQSVARGIDVQFHIDHFTRMVTDGEIDYIPSIRRAEGQHRALRRAAKAQAIEEMQSSGVPVTITNPADSLYTQVLPGSGRNHIKIGIVDDVAFLGGINLSDRGFTITDIMIAVTDPVLVGGLADLFSNPRPREDYAITSGDTKLLVDSGKRGESLILDSALEAIRTAKRSIKLTSQFTPDGKIPQALAEAHKRGVDVQVVVSAPEKISERIPRGFDRINAATLKMLGVSFPTYEHPSWVHIKGLLVDEETDTPRIITGSHNLSGKGVNLGNQEIALDSSNRELIGNFSRTFSCLMGDAQLRR